MNLREIACDAQMYLKRDDLDATEQTYAEAMVDLAAWLAGDAGPSPRIQEVLPYLR